MVVKELVALLGIKTDKKGFDQANKGMGKVIKIAKAAAAAFAALKVVQFAKGVVEETAAAGDAIDKLSKRSGVATEALQGLGHAAELSGASMGDVETALKKLQASQVEASEGVTTYADEFKRLGVEVKDAEGNFKDTPALLLEMSDALNGLDSQAEKTQVAMKLLGRSGTSLLPMFAEGSEGIRAMMQEMQELGGIMDEDLIQYSADFVDNQRRMDVAMMGIKNSITKEILPAVNDLTSGFIDFWKANGQIIRQHMGTVFGAIGRVIMSNVRFFGRLVKTVLEFVSNMSPLTKKLLGIGAAVKAIGVLIQMGPVGKILLLIAAIGLLIDDFETWRKGGKSVIGDIMKWLGDLLGMDLSYEAWVEYFDKLSADFAEAGKAIGFFFDNINDESKDASEEWGKLFDEMWLVLKDYLSLANEWWAELFADMGFAIVEFFGGMRDSIAGWLQGVGDSIKAWSAEVVEAVVAPFRAAGEWLGVLDKKSPSGGKAAPSAAAAGARGLLGSAASKATAQGVVGSAVGAKVRGASLVNAPNTKMEISVHGTPGMDEKRLGQEVGRQVEKQLMKQNRAAMRAFTRSPAGAGI